MTDKRRHPRFVVTGVHGKMVFSSRVEIANLSLGGVALKADRRLNIGSEYTLRIEKDAQNVEIKGVVVWSTLSSLVTGPDGESVAEYSAGLRFTGLFTAAFEGLFQFLDENRVLQEQRLSGVRFQIGEPDLAVLDSPQHYEVRLLSRSGMLIESEHPLEPEHVYAMEILPPGLEPIRLKGRVASYFEVLDATPRHYELGIEFLELPVADAKRLEAYLTALSAS